MQIQEKAHRILQQSVCDNCLGRQFAQLLSGLTNRERGKLLRTLIAMSMDKEHYEGDIELSNFHGFQFHKFESKDKLEKKRCVICEGMFDNLDKLAEKIAKVAKKYEFSTFLVGTKLSFELISREENLWERVGIDYCEPLKAELNRELGKVVEKKVKARYHSRPDINFVISLPEGTVDVQINPIFIYGEYQKLVRGIPQTRWPSKKYKTSIEEIMAVPFMKVTRGASHKLHGLGREDIDARCLGWRPFVLEILEPRSRTLNLKSLSKKIGKGIRVRNLRLSNIEEVRRIKEERADKTYRALVLCEGISRKDLQKLRALVGEIKQKTPERVVHRRADKFRHRKLKSLKTKYVSSKKFTIEVRCEAGLYVKELVSGDNGRTTPSASSILQQPCICKELDVTAIHNLKAKK
ncbi:MAG: tRNA pseudouridine(54/55) synthase Pus10 [Candidatus Aenigmarchaeota archaeon]|nr:tRNA pseudouridine(54/55) synthase Pus10 [Candidatus Aenigmarchaeota archaeon]